jgi:predicted ATPase
VRGEQQFPVPPLRLPNLAQLPEVGTLTEYSALALFVARAEAVQPGFHLTSATAPAIATICARLDGLPLAIELAAMRVKLLPPEALLARLEQRLALLTNGARDLPLRQQTLRAAIGWSYELLDAGEQTLFSRLSVFVGGCTLTAAEAVCNTSGDLPREVLDGLATLVDTSLLWQEADEDSEPRFVMLETIREYAAERLEGSGEAEALRQWHTRYYLALAEEAALALHGPQQQIWGERLAHEHDNLRAALAWSLDHDRLETALDLAAALGVFWERRGYLLGGITWLTRILERTPESSLGRAKALIWAGRLSHQKGDATGAHKLLSEALAIGNRLGDTRTIADARLNLLFSYAEDRRYTEEKTALCRDLLTMYQALGDDRGKASVLIYLGEIALRAGAYGEAQAYLRDSLALAERAGDVRGAAAALHWLARLAMAQGNPAGAATLEEQSRALYAQIGDQLNVGRVLIGLGEIARQSGDSQRAEAFYQQSLALLQPTGNEDLVANIFLVRGNVAVVEGRTATAAEHYTTSMEAFARLGDVDGVIWCLESTAMIGVCCGRVEEAASLLGASAALRLAYGIPPDPSDYAEMDRNMAQVRAACSANAFTTAWAVGQSMDLTAALAQARALLAAGATRSESREYEDGT